MTRAELNTQIDADITNKTTASSITPSIDGANRKKIADYVDEQIENLPIGVKTSSAYALTGTQQVLTSDFNFCNFGGGQAFLPPTSVIGKEIFVTALSANIDIWSNEANEAKIFITMGTFLTKVTLANNETYRFTYVGIAGYWKAELI
jgi:hypothetical protein